MTLLKINRLLPIYISSVLLKFEVDIQSQSKVRVRKPKKSNMAARRPFWKWHRWKSIGFCLRPPSTCIWNLKLKFQSKLDLCSGNHAVYRQTDGRTDPQNGVLWLLLFINLGAFFLCGYWVLCGCVCMSRPTKRCLVATFVHKFGCLFSCVAIGFVWLQINKIATKVPTVPKNSHRSGVL